MTVKELKERLEKFDDRLLVMIPNPTTDSTAFWAIAANDVWQGVNEADGCLFIDYTYDDEEN